MTTPDQLREIVTYLQQQVRLEAGDHPAVVFEPPEMAAMVRAGLDGATVERLLAVAWWSEMVTDVIETPEFAEPGAAAEVILDYARDVIQEYIGKRFALNV